MGYIDAHVHVWTDDTDTYPFAAGHDGDKVPHTFFPEDVLGHAQPCGVDRIVLVQMSYYGADNRYMLQVSVRRHRHRRLDGRLTRRRDEATRRRGCLRLPCVPARRARPELV